MWLEGEKYRQSGRQKNNKAEEHMRPNAYGDHIANYSSTSTVSQSTSEFSGLMYNEANVKLNSFIRRTAVFNACTIFKYLYLGTLLSRKNQWRILISIRPTHSASNKGTATPLTAEEKNN